MRFTSWPSLLVLFGSLTARAIDLPKFATKQTLENLRFVSANGAFSYAQKRSGALSLVGNFKTTDLLDAPPDTNYLVTSSRDRKKLVVEVERASHQELDLLKLHEIWTLAWGGTSMTKVGMGRFPRLHLGDEWLTWFDPKTQLIHVQFLPVAKRHYVIRLGRKHNPYFFPEVLMLNPETVYFTDVNNKGQSALLTYNLVENKMSVALKAEQSGTRFELCRGDNFAALGEFSYPDARRGSSISVMAWKVVPGLAGFTKVYSSNDNDLGQMSCADGKVWFVRTVSEDRALNTKVTEAAALDIATSKVEIRSSLEKVTNIINMDGRLLIPIRDEFYVLSGDSGSAQEQLQRPNRSAP